MNVATADRSPGVHADCGPLQGRRRASHIRQYSRLCALLLSIAVAGCARNVPGRDARSVAPEANPAPLRSAAAPRRHPPQTRYIEPRIRKPDAALLAPQPAPDCDFRRPDLKTVDPDAWARLKAEYELQCYQDAEKAARKRLSLLQEAGKCEIEPASPGRQPKLPAR